MDADIKAHVDALAATSSEGEVAHVLALVGIALTELRRVANSLEAIANAANPKV